MEEQLMMNFEAVVIDGKTFAIIPRSEYELQEIENAWIVNMKNKEFQVKEE